MNECERYSVEMLATVLYMRSNLLNTNSCSQNQQIATSCFEKYRIFELVVIPREFLESIKKGKAERNFKNYNFGISFKNWIRILSVLYFSLQQKMK